MRLPWQYTDIYYAFIEVYIPGFENNGFPKTFILKIFQIFRIFHVFFHYLMTLKLTRKINLHVVHLF
eukprot:UN17621